MIRVTPLFFMLLFFCAPTLNAQQLTLSLGSFYEFAPGHRAVTQQEYLSVQAEPQLTGDTLYVRTLVRSQWRNRTSFVFLGGAQVSLHLSWEVGEKFALQSGLGLRVHAYEIRQESRYEGVERIPLDTLEDYIPPRYFPGSSTGSCSYYTNSYNDIGQLRPIPLYQVMELDIPLALEYDLIPGVLQAVGGAHLRSPLFSRHIRELASLQQETLPNGEVACTYYKEERVDRTGGYLSDATLAGSLGLRLWLGRLGLEANVQKQFSSRFATAPQPYYTSSRYHLRPYEVGVKVLYQLTEPFRLP